MFVWTISASDTDPVDILGPVPDDGWLYLWASGLPHGAAGVVFSEFRLTGSLTPTEFEPLNGVEVYSGPIFPDLGLTFPGCTNPSRGLLAGRVRVEVAMAVDPTTWGRAKAKYR